MIAPEPPPAPFTGPLAAGAAIAMFRFKVGMLPTLAASALLGCGYFLLAG